MPRNWVAYVGNFSFPWGQPGSRRVAGIAKSISKYRDLVIISTAIRETESETLNEDGTQGLIKYVNPNSSHSSTKSLFSKANNYFFKSGLDTVKWIEEQQQKPSHIIVYGGSCFFTYAILRWARKNDVPVIADVVEWYSPKQLKGGRFGPLYLSALVTRNFLYPRCDGIIAISRHLFDHFSKIVASVVRVPPTLHVDNPLPPTPPKDPAALTLVYAGSPGKKDLIFPVIQALQTLVGEGLAIKLVLAGPTRQQLAKILESPLPDFVEALGRIPQEDITSVLARADFSILFRPTERFTEAGFPTKFVESMAAGVPVLANITSDLEIYMHGEKVGLVAPSVTQESITATIRRAASLSPEARQLMRKAAIALAQQEFDCRQYIDKLHSFLSDLSHKD